MRTCATCQHCDRGPLDMPLSWHCRSGHLPMEQTYVTGQLTPKISTCQLLRADASFCGPTGAWWSPVEEQQPPADARTPDRTGPATAAPSHLATSQAVGAAVRLPTEHMVEQLGGALRRLQGMITDANVSPWQAFRLYDPDSAGYLYFRICEQIDLECETLLEKAPF